MKKPKLEIRKAREEDVPYILEIYRPFVEDNAVSFETRLPGPSEMRERLLETLKTYPWLIAEWDGRVAGYAYACSHRSREAYKWSCESSVYVAADFHRLNIAKNLYEHLFQILSAQGLVNVFAGITMPNLASVSFHESIGFKPIGVYENIGFKFARWWSVGWWQLRLSEEVPLQKIIPFSELQMSSLEN